MQQAPTEQAGIVIAMDRLDEDGGSRRALDAVDRCRRAR
jgi:hypothetical protein